MKSISSFIVILILTIASIVTAIGVIYTQIQLKEVTTTTMTTTSITTTTVPTTATTAPTITTTTITTTTSTTTTIITTSNCTAQYLENYQCSSNWRQKQYKYSNCSLIWLNFEYCNYGCSNEKCIQQQNCSDGTQYSQCSSNKPKYCQNGTLIDKCSICNCSSSQSCNITVESCYISTPICDNIIINGNSNDKLDVVFVPVGFNDTDEFNSLVMEHIDAEGEYNGTLYYDPFKTNRNKFNFLKTHHLPAEIENNFMQWKCQYSTSDYWYTCARNIKNWLSENNCVYDKIIVIFNNIPPNTGGGWAEALNGTIAITIAREYPPFENQGHMETVHELAHLLGLTDQVVGATEFTGYGVGIENIPNCDVVGCPKWCQDYVKTPSGDAYILCKNLSENDCKKNVNCFWRNVTDEFYKTQCIPLDDDVNVGINCLEGVGCYHNCGGVGAWRSADYAEPGHRPTSMMFYMANALGFDSVDKRYLESVLSSYK